MRFDSCSCGAKEIVTKGVGLQHLIPQSSSPLTLVENHSLFLPRLVDDGRCDALVGLLILIEDIEVPYHNVDGILRLFDHASLSFWQR